MSSQSVDINKKIIALTNTSKYNSFIFDVELDISYIADSAWGSQNLYNISRFYKALSTIIVYQIGHKYKQWKVVCHIIADKLYNEFSLLKLSGKEWKGIISVAGQYHAQYSVSAGYSEMIYDWFTYDGCLAVPENLKKQFSYDIFDVYLQYTIRFFLSPALSGAQHLYSTRGYEKISKPSLLYDPTYNTKIKIEQMVQKKEYNHLEVWQAALS